MCLFTLLEIERRLKKTKVYYTLYYPVWKETKRKPLKRAAPKDLFSTVYFTDATCFHKCFLYHVITGRHYNS